jgi:molybdate transport system regulatory protein
MTPDKQRASKASLPGLKRKRPSRSGYRNLKGYTVGGRIWVEKDGELYLGWGRAMLLENIERLGSISAAARAMGLGYRNAWLWIEAMNRLAEAPLVEKQTGGAGGGHAQLTESGRRAVNDYRRLRARFQEFLKQSQ